MLPTVLLPLEDNYAYFIIISFSLSVSGMPLHFKEEEILDRTGQNRTGQDRTGQDRDRILKPQFCDLELPVVFW
uniref:Uncharacterized protein n=1 Tax=Rhizophagus irregularis (strain DAOM 181602 / DAOM 197198 / MUCL 43194) TaxID=747089 RepID=U9T160_RHIID